MGKNLAVFVLILFLGAAGAIISYAVNAIPFNPTYPSPDPDELVTPEATTGEDPGAMEAGDAPIDPAALEGRRIAAAPDNTASGGPGGTPAVLPALHEQLVQRIRKSEYTVNLSLYDFATGGQIKINAHEPLYPASMIKTLLLLAALEQEDRGCLSLQETHVLTESDKYAGTTRVAGAGILQYVPAGSSYTLEELLALMVGLSDNVAANILFDRIGPPRIKAMARCLGLEHTSFTRKFFDLESPGPTNTATAFDLNRMLVALENSEIASDKLSEKGINMMLATDDKRIGRFIRGQAEVANKVGTDSSVIGDMALVYFPARPPLALTIAVADPPDQDEAIVFIGELSALIVEQILALK